MNVARSPAATASVLFTRCGDREHPLYSSVHFLRAGLTRLQAKVKLKVAVWPRHCACWPIQTLMASLKAYKREESNGEKSLVKEIRHRSLLLLLACHFVSQMLANLWRMNIAYNLIQFPFDFVF